MAEAIAELTILPLGERVWILSGQEDITGSTLTFDGENLEVASGKSLQLKASANQGASNRKVIWSVVEDEDEKACATITAGGKLTAAKNLISAKTVTVKATAADNSGFFATKTVTVRPLAQGVQAYIVGQTAFGLPSGENRWVAGNTTCNWDMTTQGDIITLNANVFPNYGTNEDGLPDDRNAIQTVNWKSSSERVAVFLKNSDGTLARDGEGNVQLKIKKPGAVTITVTAADGSKQKVTFKLNVVKTIDSFELESRALAGGKSLDLAKLLKKGPSGTTTKTLRWSITGGSGAAYASVSGKGMLKTKVVTGIKTVEVTVTAADMIGYSKTFEISLHPAATKVQIWNGEENVTKKTVKLAVGETLQLTGFSQPEMAADEFVWKSSKTKVATVDANGLVTAKKKGTVTVTCTAADGTGTQAKVTVRVP